MIVGLSPGNFGSFFFGGLALGLALGLDPRCRASSFLRSARRIVRFDGSLRVPRNVQYAGPHPATVAAKATARDTVPNRRKPCFSGRKA